MAGYSVAQQFRGATVLLTGATGYIGGLVLEKLLRATEVDVIHVLLRPKGPTSAGDRLLQLLQKNVYHLVHNQPQLLRKVQPVSGDITQPGLGLDISRRQTLQQHVDVILHCAADIRLELDIKSALRANYLGTKAMLQFAAGCLHLRALVHTSSCYVNMNQPRSSVVYEQLYPLKFGTTVVDCEELVQDLLALPDDAADTRATALALRWGFPNNYTFSKHLGEQLVARYQQQQGVPAAVVRPSLVCSVAYDPIPGYIGNWAGPIGAAAALAIGFYHSLGCVSSQPLHVWDCMPADLVANALLATAAATAANQSDSIAAQAATAAQADTHCSTSSSKTGGSTGVRMLIVHSSSSSTYPLTLMEGWNHAVEFLQVHKPRFRLSWNRLPKMPHKFQPKPEIVQRERRWTALKVKLACLLLRCVGLQRAAARLESGFDALCVYGSSKTDKDLVFTAHALQVLEQQMLVEEQQRYRLVMRPGMPVPGSAAAALDDDDASASKQASLASSVNSRDGHAGASHDADADQQSLSSSRSAVGRQQRVLTWRRYYHSQLAAVYSMLYRTSVPKLAHTAAGTPVEHDFAFVK